MHLNKLLSAVLLSGTLAAPGADGYLPGSHSRPQPDVPRGQVANYAFHQSKLFRGATRDYWVYVPSQCDPARAPPVMVFQDGLSYNAPVVFDKREVR